MISAIFYIILYIVIIIFDVIPFIKNKDKKVLYIYMPILLVTLTINILYGFGVKIPSPIKPISEILTKIFGISEVS